MVILSIATCYAIGDFLIVSAAIAGACLARAADNRFIRKVPAPSRCTPRCQWFPDKLLTKQILRMGRFTYNEAILRIEWLAHVAQSVVSSGTRRQGDGKSMRVPKLAHMAPGRGRKENVP